MPDLYHQHQQSEVDLSLFLRQSDKAPKLGHEINHVCFAVLLEDQADTFASQCIQDAKKAVKFVIQLF